jgi:hypothetical protein
MKKNTIFSNQKFEFLLRINNNIICQRYFSVENYNNQILKSDELKELMDNLCGMNNGSFGSCGIIPNYLKDKSVDYLWDRYDPYSEIRKEDESFEKNVFKNEDIFTFEIRVDKNLVAKSIFSGNYFPTMVRYQVNIKPIIPKIIEEITEYFSMEDVNLVVK